MNLSQLNELSGEITPESLIKAGVISRLPVKILANGTLKKKLNVKANKFSEKAKQAIDTSRAPPIRAIKTGIIYSL